MNFKSKNSAKSKSPTKKMKETKFVELTFDLGYNNEEFAKKKNNNGGLANNKV